MSWLLLALWEVRNVLRELVPSRVVRRSLLGVGFTIELAFCAFVSLAPLPSRADANLGMLGGFFALNLALVSGLAALALSRLVDAARQLDLVQVSPLGAARAVWLLLVPALLLGSIPLTALLLPFAIAVGRRAPLVALGMAAAACMILAWGLLVAVASAGELVARWGRGRAAQLLRTWGTVLPIATLLAFKPLVSLQTPRTLTLTILVASAALLPL
ncbi:MAG: hypothetical protein RL685_6121, partial [Pseudomonadota bacterium]